ncbi:VOC family protein [Pseudoduganella namucuonensis]|uniref:3,4-dihydroxy-9,10-secoandrosta-1,3,5(10)-triene-9,17-dione 4,5-dioxygenase n=1 Tax=Pseudoduganella namucuonensis TaxID=1035707 RepID=A0A1I7LSA3_9BURK|nr:VOC family protein [Pseudoduganella namucuonensis]SFV12508.1 3,4-dihydroxy-9,10-secoandrosta-1,3,5(10)-triene-9,17-dione 4,5-dioxygenase [Pseudoduganella namucuonensis]
MIDIRGLAYVVVNATDVSRWERYGEDVLGMMAQPAPEGGVYLKMDERPFRFLVQAAGTEGYAASGWEVLNAEAFELALRELEQAGAEPVLGSAADCALRKAQQVVRFRDPSGNRHEIVWGCQRDFQRFVSPQGVERFVTGDLGMGHTVLPAPNFDATWAFFRDVLGFGLSDIYKHRAAPDAPVQRIHFCHCNNGRQHSVALFEAEIPSGCAHVNVEVPSITDVGRALDRRQRHGVKLMASMGQHANDQMFSFYMATPSGFALEYGAGGLVVDWSRHAAFEATEISLWGHDFSLGLATGDTN